jgi:hypothetical protein
MAAPLSCDPCEEMLADYLLHALEPEVVQAVTEYPAPVCAVGHSLRPLKLSWPTSRTGCRSAPPVELVSRLLAGAVEGALFTASAPVPQRPPRRTPWRPRMLCSASVWGGGPGTSSGKLRWCTSAGRRCSTCQRQPRPNFTAGDRRDVAKLLTRGQLPPINPQTWTVPATLHITRVGATLSLRLRSHRIPLPTAAPPPLCLRIPSGNDATLPLMIYTR